jgi:hypothetical protein
VSGFGPQLEIENGETRLFMHARQLTQNRWENDLPPYRVVCDSEETEPQIVKVAVFFWGRLS